MQKTGLKLFIFTVVGKELAWVLLLQSVRVYVGIWLSDSYPAFFLLIATTSNKNF